MLGLKGRLCSIISDDAADAEQIEYLISLIDFFLTKKIKATKENIDILIEEVVNTAIMQLKFDLLDYVKPFAEDKYVEV